MTQKQAVCFTGHRQIPIVKVPEITQVLMESIEQLIGDGFDCFYCGGALGFDTLAAYVVLGMKKKHPKVQLIMVLPCKDQDAKWNGVDRAKYHEILNAADAEIYISDIYYNGCTKVRNQYLIDHATLCIAYLTNARSGTGQTVRLAQMRGLIVWNLARDIISSQ